MIFIRTKIVLITSNFHSQFDRPTSRGDREMYNHPNKPYKVLPDPPAIMQGRYDHTVHADTPS